MNIHDYYEPAFPQQQLDAQGNPREEMSRGLTVRDYFAAKAMQGFLASPFMAEDAGKSDEHLAGWAYKVADAMMQARAESLHEAKEKGLTA